MNTSIDESAFNPFRVIPCLLVRSERLVKTCRFKKPQYLGDVINALRIFNEKEVDEIAVFDIDASKLNQRPNLDFIAEIAGECFMPLAYGGGVTSADEVRQIIKAGVEKVVLNSAAFLNPRLISEAANVVGSQSVVVSIDVKKNWLGNRGVYTHSGSRRTKYSPSAAAKLAIDAGAGELFIQDIDRDGTMKGYDLSLIELIASSSTVPVVALGGAASVRDLAAAVNVGADAAAAGALFVFQGPHRAVLISYPSSAEVNQAFTLIKETNCS